MPRIVDGDNLLGTWPGKKRSDPERRQLAFEIARFARRERRRIVVVFDGPAPPGQALGPDVHFSGHGRKADDLILDLLRREDGPRGWTVITDDHALADQCRHLGCRIEKGARFRSRLFETTGGDKPERVEDLEYWMRVFGKDDPDA